MTYDELELVDTSHMEKGVLDTLLSMLMRLSSQNTAEAVSVQRRLSEAEQDFILNDDPAIRRVRKAEIAGLKRDVNIIRLYAKEISSQCSGVQTKLRAFGGIG